jgi:hypothetical protein
MRATADDRHNEAIGIGHALDDGEEPASGQRRTTLRVASVRTSARNATPASRTIARDTSAMTQGLSATIASASWSDRTSWATVSIVTGPQAWHVPTTAERPGRRRSA